MKLLNYFFNLLLLRGGNLNPREHFHSDDGESSSIMCRAEDYDEISERRKRGDERARERNRRTEMPPADDCCPICRGGFSVPCRTPCGHWFCGDCILQYWNHGAALRPCKCPLCSQMIRNLVPASQSDQCEDVTTILQNVCEYNRVFVGGSFGFFQKMLAIPLFLRRMLLGMMDPDANCLVKVRLVAISLGALYAASPFDFLPTDNIAAVDLFDYSAIALVLAMYVARLYRRSWQMKQERQLASSLTTADTAYA